MSSQALGAPRTKDEFNKSSQDKTATPKRRKLRTRAFAIKFTDGERAYLEQKAGSLPLGTYCRRILLGDKEEKRSVLRKPKVDEKQIALVLAELGQSRLASNVNQLAKHANMGTLDASTETEQELKDAAQAIIEMRKALFMALGLKP